MISAAATVTRGDQQFAVAELARSARAGGANVLQVRTPRAARSRPRLAAEYYRRSVASSYSTCRVRPSRRSPCRARRRSGLQFGIASGPPRRRSGRGSSIIAWLQRRPTGERDLRHGPGFRCRGTPRRARREQRERWRRWAKSLLRARDTGRELAEVVGHRRRWKQRQVEARGACR